jgi:uncharacterized protein DUF6893
MIKKTLMAAAAATAGLAIAYGWPDIKRYAKIRQVSAQHPELVPAKGRTVYPHSHAGGAPDGTGDFDSASRGGPTRT